jgi:hypothetical protein
MPPLPPKIIAAPWGKSLVTWWSPLGGFGRCAGPLAGLIDGLRSKGQIEQRIL